MKRSDLPPGPRLPVPLQTVWWTLRAFSMLERCRRRYGDIFTVRLAREGTWVILSDPEHVKQVFTGDPRVFHAGEANRILLPLVGPQSLLLLDEAPHMRHRKLLLPPFHGERMRSYAGMVREVAEADIATWPRGEPFALQPRMQAITLDIIMRAVLGVSDGPERDELQAALRKLLADVMSPEALAALMVFGPQRVGRVPILSRLLAQADRLLRSHIAARRRDPLVEQRADILSLLVQTRDERGDPLTDDELRDELMTLLVAGHETTATALSWAFERLVRQPSMLERLRAEADAGGDELADAVAKETLRMRPVIAVVVRRLTEPVEIGGHRLPAGATVAPSIHLVHRRADVYPDPHIFRPERFLERPAGTYTWIPFGGGVRRCIGSSFALFEMKHVLQAVVRAVDLRAAETPPERPVRRAITMNPEHGGRVIVAERESGRHERAALASTA